MMSFADKLKVFLIDGEYVIGASFPDGQVAVVNSERRTLAAHVKLPVTCGYAHAVSSDGRYLAVGYEYVQLSSLQVWGLASHSIIAERSKSYPFMLEFAPGGRSVVYEATCGKPGAYVYYLSNGRTERIVGAIGPPNMTFARDGGMLMPATRAGGQAFHVTLKPFNVMKVPLPTNEDVWLLRASPISDTFLILDSGAAVSNVDTATGELIWKRKILEADWLSYSGDGRFVAVLECHSNGEPKRLVVLDATSGQIVRTIEHAERASDPLAGPKVLCLSGRFVNLETGEVEDGVSDLNWWRSLLGKERGEHEA